MAARSGEDFSPRGGGVVWHIQVRPKVGARSARGLKPRDSSRGVASFMILMNKYSQNLFRHSDGSILDKNIKTDRTEKDGSGLLFFVAASLVLSLIIFYTS